MDRTLGDNSIIVDGKRQFTNGPPGTTIGADHLNAVQEELMTVIANAGLTPSSGDLTQLYQAILNMNNAKGWQGLHAMLLYQFISPSSPKTFRLNDVAWNGELYVAVGESDGADAFIVTSPDGRAWTERTPTVAKTVALNAVVWNGELWVAVGDADGVDSYILTSPDGTTWTERVPTVAVNVDLYSVAWGNGLFVAVGDDDAGATYVITSPDGTVWTRRTPSGATAHPSYTVVYNGSIWTYWAYGNPDPYISVDGITWAIYMTTGDVPERGFNSICWNGSLFVGVGGDVFSQHILISADGYTWQKTGALLANLYKVIWNGSIFVAIGHYFASGPFVITSADGVNWVDRTGCVTTGGQEARSICWAGDRFTIVGGTNVANVAIRTTRNIESLGR